MVKLWDKKGAKLHPAAASYMLGDELMADALLLPYDCDASSAHARMLGKIGVLTAPEVKKLTVALAEIKKLGAAGKFPLRPENEDVHTEIELYLTQKLGELGKRIHTGRSRNDQVLTALRLYERDAINETQRRLKKTAESIWTFAAKHEFLPMPGFTHMQHAMPSSAGQWAGSFVESLLADDLMLDSAFRVIDRNPLGSAAGFGTAIPIDREETTRLLGFSATQINPIFCQNSRGKFEAYVAHALLQVMLTLGKIANDIVVFSCQEFGFFRLDQFLTTGSSIMPQKRNPDIMEVMRGNVSVVQSLQLQIQTLGQNLLSGYNKDLKFTKQALMQAFGITQESLDICTLAFEGLSPVPENLLAAFKDREIFAADSANRLVMEGMSFRDAYREVGENLSTLPAEDPVRNIKGKKHLGATGNLGLKRLKKMLEEI